MKIFGSHSSLTSSKLTGIMVSGDVALSSRRKRSEMCRRGSCHKTLKYELKVTEYSCKKGRDKQGFSKLGQVPLLPSFIAWHS